MKLSPVGELILAALVDRPELLRTLRAAADCEASVTGRPSSLQEFIEEIEREFVRRGVGDPTHPKREAVDERTDVPAEPRMAAGPGNAAVPAAY